jgi:hypothetical protein
MWPDYTQLVNQTGSTSMIASERRGSTYTERVGESGAEAGRELLRRRHLEEGGPCALSSHLEQHRAAAVVASSGTKGCGVGLSLEPMVRRGGPASYRDGAVFRRWTVGVIRWRWRWRLGARPRR